MTVSATTNKITYDGNAATTVWSFPFPGVAAVDLAVYYTDAAGLITLLSPTLYTVILNPALAPNPTGSGGTVTYPLSGSPIALGTKLTILRTLIDNQTTSLANQGTLYQPVIESEFDYLTMLIQQIAELQGRAIEVAVSDPIPVTLPSAVARAGLFMAFDSSGNPTASVGPSSGTAISSVMIPVVTAATLALARAAFGLGTTATENVNFGLQKDVSGARNLDANSVISAVGVSRAIVASDHATHIVASAAITLTMPRVNTLWNGFGFYVHASSGNVTIAIDSHDSFETLNTGASLVLMRGTAAIITTNAATSGVIYIMQAPRFLAASTAALSGAYAIVQSDNGTTFQAGGSAYYTISLGAAASFSGPFSVRIFNNDTGRGKLISLSGVTAFVLWPGQDVVVNMNAAGTAWLVTAPGRWKPNSAATFHCNPTLGSDSNDGLAAGADAFLTISKAISTLRQYYDTAFGGATIQLDAGTYNVGGGIDLNYQITGPNQNFIIGDVGTPGNVVLNCSPGAGCFNGRDGVGTWTITGIKFQTVGNGSTAISVTQYFQVDIANCDFGAFPLGTHMGIADLGSLDIVGNYTVSGAPATHLNVAGNSHVNYGTFNVSVPNSLTFTLWIACTRGGYLNAGGVPMSFSGAGAGAGSAGQKYAVTTGGIISSTATVYPGNVAGVVDGATFGQYS